MIGKYVITTITAPAAAVIQRTAAAVGARPTPRRPSAGGGRAAGPELDHPIPNASRVRTWPAQYLLRSTWLVLAHCCAALVSSDCHWLANDGVGQLTRRCTPGPAAARSWSPRWTARRRGPRRPPWDLAGRDQAVQAGEVHGWRSGHGGDVGAGLVDLDPVAQVLRGEQPGQEVHHGRGLGRGHGAVGLLRGDAPLAVAVRAADDADRRGAGGQRGAGGGDRRLGEHAVLAGEKPAEFSCGMYQLPPHSMPTLPWVSSDSVVSGGVVWVRAASRRHSCSARCRSSWTSWPSSFHTSA